MTPTYCIYRATNGVNGKTYVGFTYSLEIRREQHEWSAARGCMQLFHKAIRKYGPGAFTWEILFETPDKNLALYEMEEKFIRESNSYAGTGHGYNCSYGGNGAGIIVTLERKAKIRATNLRKGLNFVNNGATEAARLANTGRKQSAEWKKKRTALRCRRVVIDGTTYESGRAAAKALNVCPATITQMIARGAAIKLAP